MAKITGFECSKCGANLLPQAAPTICPKDGGPLYVRYDLAAIGRNTTRDSINSGPKSMWRYAAVLPDAEPVTLGSTAAYRHMLFGPELIESRVVLRPIAARS